MTTQFSYSRYDFPAIPLQDSLVFAQFVRDSKIWWARGHVPDDPQDLEELLKNDGRICRFLVTCFKVSVC